MPRLFEIRPPLTALILWQRLVAAGFCAHFVGGCVRDALLGLTPSDWDICTSATPDEVRACFPDARVLETGIAHGTVTVLPPAAFAASAESTECIGCAECGNPPALSTFASPVSLATPASYEITTYRTETGYSDHRRPDSVRFTTTVASDLARRDFTVNAMAYSPDDGLIDLHAGQADLAARVVRCVGDPARRFAEDALRILRAVRFCATLGFSLTPETARAALAARGTLRFVSRERVYSELTKLLCGAHAGAVLREYPEVIFAALPPLAPMHGFAQNSPYHDKDVWLHTVAAVEACPPDGVTRWAVLLHDSGKPQCYTQDAAGRGHFYGHGKTSAALARALFTDLHTDCATRDSVCRLVLWHDVPLEPTAACAARWLHRLGEADLRRLLAVKRADSAAHAPCTISVRLAQTNAFAQFLDDALSAQTCLRLADLAINGSDILACGVPKGPRVGILLRGMLHEVLAGTLPNERNALLTRLRCDPKGIL